MVSSMRCMWRVPGNWLNSFKEVVTTPGTLKTGGGYIGSSREEVVTTVSVTCEDAEARNFLKPSKPIEIKSYVDKIKPKPLNFILL